ncbi:aminotransferase class V-fold PLP-dependent enzyme [Arcicella sp. LKC2W]|uniref:aminotransferase class V-fold PLP-dependent enzyme n=1 Tax=Arcicella sp. LKC2W TaxID=2984198 RepID=UPI002B213832|nr:aminotransferase class V-fold PLP-dependent enzyme [Arcicella sp. LKC2W]MEA5461219.1 aminotransferase class V-fold PLP-dependent enzyme [Arcicella sp. LKC2W]
MRKTYFTPGPAELFPTVERHYQDAFEQQLGSISHRSQKFRDIYKHTVEQLRILMNVPETNGIFFTSSATEIWERLIQNTVEHESFHLVNGSFSKKFYDFSVDLNKFAHKFEKPFGEGFDNAEIIVPEYAELICTTANETSSGVQMRATEIHKLKRANKDKFICVDMVSSAPYPDLDFNIVDSAFFSVQKSFGMPAGLGCWIVNPAMLEKAERMKTHENQIGTYHNLPSLFKNFSKFETPETPNVMAIYVLGKVAEDMNKIGIENIRKQTEKKAKVLYDFAEKCDFLEIFVKNPDHRSQTVVVVNVKDKSAADIIKQVQTDANMVIGSGYGDFKATQLRIANFAAVNLEQVETLVEALRKV